MSRAARLFEDYPGHHRTPGNKWRHRFGIPLIMLSLPGMLSIVRFEVAGVMLDAAIVLIALPVIYYTMDLGNTAG